MIYLASPYSHPDPAVREFRFREACRAAGVTLSIGFNRRHAPSFVEMLKSIRSGRIGDVLHIEATHSGPTGYSLDTTSWRSTRAEAPAGGMTARGIHTLDGMIQIAGPVASVYAFSDKRKLAPEVDMDDTTSMLLRFAGGATGSLSTVFVTADGVQSFPLEAKAALASRIVAFIAERLSGRTASQPDAPASVGEGGGPAVPLARRTLRAKAAAGHPRQ